MLAVCEDAGLAAAAAAGKLSVGSLLQWSAACGCGLDTVPVPGPGPGWPAVYAAAEPGAPAAAAAGAAGSAGGGGGGGAAGAAGAAEEEEATAAAAEEDKGRDEALLQAFTGALLDTALLAARMQKPLAARLLPLPGRRAGERTDFDNPYLVESVVLPLE
jgi:hypothetical protein